MKSRHFNTYCYKQRILGNSLVVHWIGFQAFMLRSWVQSPGEIKTLEVMWHSLPTKNKRKNVRLERKLEDFSVPHLVNEQPEAQRNKLFKSHILVLAKSIHKLRTLDLV